MVRGILGYTPEDYNADPELILKNIHPEDKPRLKSALQNSYVENVTRRLICKDVRVVWCQGVHVPVDDEAGNWIATKGISRGYYRARASRNQSLAPSLSKLQFQVEMQLRLMFGLM